MLIVEEGRGIHGNSVLSVQFFCGLKTALKFTFQKGMYGMILFILNVKCIKTIVDVLIYSQNTHENSEKWLLLGRQKGKGSGEG